MERIPTWSIILVTTILFFGGLQLAKIFEPAVDENELEILLGKPILLFLSIGIPVVILEALFWTVGFIELGAKFLRSPLLGASAGILGYGVLFHWSEGVFSVLLTSWIALVLNTSYVFLRQSSRKTAIYSTLAHKVAFIVYAAFIIHTSGA